jgi:chromosome segregation protein
MIGFKSFVDRIHLSFPEGITAIVGPNGCGKSNVVDSILWAIGERSAKHLRGKLMEDVIFGGTDGRKPFGMAEVNLTFQNDGGLAPTQYEPYSEITITRRLYRSGEVSTPTRSCRLRTSPTSSWIPALGDGYSSSSRVGRVSSRRTPGPAFL